MNEKAGSMTSKDGCNYGVDCPLAPKEGVPYCCNTCYRTKSRYLTDANRHLWTEKNGFHSSEGCRLSRDEMPQECREYDCRSYPFVAILTYNNGRWHADEVIELVGDELTVVKLAINKALKDYNG